MQKKGEEKVNLKHGCVYYICKFVFYFLLFNQPHMHTRPESIKMKNKERIFKLKVLQRTVLCVLLMFVRVNNSFECERHLKKSMKIKNINISVCNLWSFLKESINNYGMNGLRGEFQSHLMRGGGENTISIYYIFNLDDYLLLTLLSVFRHFRGRLRGATLLLEVKLTLPLSLSLIHTHSWDIFKCL